ncbi:hypothetical protein [Hymenobacter persicinus]|uniref:Uncharacterized protein n=1 Tax=Hymenobacter persicinus TaxID=2025506 RepID=A0A4Q5LAX7_9BACT|nr:hypothetical protein [Hymenobacter persicinus]RYU78901.1 hypothetical protein EWM57_12005 [Hymenobacter persicinus]
MAYSITQLATKADCDLVLVPLTQKRDQAANRRSNLAFQLQTFSDPAGRNAELSRLNRRIADAQADLPTLPEGKTKRDLENELATNTKRRNQLLNQSDAQGSDDRVLLEFEQATLIQAHDEAVSLIGQVESHKATLPA